MPSLATFIGKDLQTIFQDIGQEATLKTITYTLDTNEKLTAITEDEFTVIIHTQPITATDDDQLISAGIADIGDLRCWVLPAQNQEGISIKDRDLIEIFDEDWEVVGLISGNWRWDSILGFVECVLRKKPILP